MRFFNVRMENMEKKYWIIRNQESEGPFASDDLRNMGISEETYIWYAGLQKWTKAGKLPEIRLACGWAAVAGMDNGVQSETTTPPAFDADRYRQSCPAGHVIPPQTPNLRQAYDAGYRQGINDARQVESADFSQAADQADNTPGTCPPTYLVWAILATILCSLPFGIVAIWFAARVQTLYLRGEYQRSSRASDRAALWTVVSVIVGLVLLPISFTIAFFG